MTTFKNTSSARALGEMEMESTAKLFALREKSPLSATQPK
jgi:hypothetical protein